MCHCDGRVEEVEGDDEDGAEDEDDDTAVDWFVGTALFLSAASVFATAPARFDARIALVAPLPALFLFGGISNWGTDCFGFLREKHRK